MAVYRCNKRTSELCFIVLIFCSLVLAILGIFITGSTVHSWPISTIDIVLIAVTLGESFVVTAISVWGLYKLCHNDDDLETTATKGIGALLIATFLLFTIDILLLLNIFQLKESMNENSADHAEKLIKLILSIIAITITTLTILLIILSFVVYSCHRLQFAVLPKRIDYQQLPTYPPMSPETLPINVSINADPRIIGVDRSLQNLSGDHKLETP